MKKTIIVLGFCLLALMFGNQQAFAKVNKQKVTFYVHLHCDGCVQKVMKNIAYEKGVKDLECSIEKQTVVVTYDANKTDVATLQKAFEKIGKPASLTEQNVKKEKDDDHDHHGHDHHHHHN